MKIKTALLASVALASCIGFFALAPALRGAEAHKEKHPGIHHAIKALEEAKAEMKAADHDFGGHRAAALKECDAAIAQLRLALQYDKD